MLKCLLAPLLETLRPHFDLSKTRLETLAVLLVGLASGRTGNLKRPKLLESTAECETSTPHLVGSHCSQCVILPEHRCP